MQEIEEGIKQTRNAIYPVLIAKKEAVEGAEETDDISLHFCTSAANQMETKLNYGCELRYSFTRADRTWTRLELGYRQCEVIVWLRRVKHTKTRNGGTRRGSANSMLSRSRWRAHSA